MLILPSQASGQGDSKPSSQWNLGPEIQVYPTGILPGIRIEKLLSSNSSVDFRIALQLIDHRDLGVHDDETGNGWGFSLAYRKYFQSTDKGLSLALRTDLWQNSIDWMDLSPLASGQTDITVLQPTVLLEYTSSISPHIRLVPSIGFGYEWNIKTVGAPTGQGAIILIGVSLNFSL